MTPTASRKVRGLSRVTVAVIVVALVIVAAASAIYFETAGKSGPPVTATTSSKDWKFEVDLSSTSVTAGQQISDTCYLTNTSGQNQTVILGNPICGASLYTQGGQQVWVYSPSATNAVQVIPAGMVLTLSFNMQTSELHAGDTYILSSAPNVDPLPGNSSFGLSLQLNQTITVGV